MIIDNGNCTNCGGEDTDTYYIKIRGETHDEVPLCEECHNAISNDIPCAE
jgi:hypothetical protein